MTLARWDIWIVSGTFAAQDIALVCQTLEEIQVDLLPFPQTIELSFDHMWDEGVVLYSGATDQ